MAQTPRTRRTSCGRHHGALLAKQDKTLLEGLDGCKPLEISIVEQYQSSETPMLRHEIDFMNCVRSVSSSSRGWNEHYDHNSEAHFDIIYLIFEFALGIFSPHATMVPLSDSGSVSTRIEPIHGGGGFRLESLSQPNTRFKVNVRADLCAPAHEGKFYFELQLPAANYHAVHGIGWCDSQWGQRVFDQHRVDMDGESLAHVLMGVGDDENSWALGRAGCTWHKMPEIYVDGGDLLPGPVPCLENGLPRHHNHGQEERSRGRNTGLCYFNHHWNRGDTIGCGIEVTQTVKLPLKLLFSVKFFLNGKEDTAAWTDCEFPEDGLFPACTLLSLDSPSTMTTQDIVFSKDSLKHLPDGYEPVYVML